MTAQVGCFEKNHEILRLVWKGRLVDKYKNTNKYTKIRDFWAYFLKKIKAI